MSDIAAEVALLFLNATGEMCFMGGARGTLFSMLVGSMARNDLSSLSLNGCVTSRISSSVMNKTFALPRSFGAEVRVVPSPEIAEAFLDVFSLGVHVHYPTFHLTEMQETISAGSFGKKHVGVEITYQP